MKINLFKKSIVIGVIGLFLLATLPITQSSEKTSNKEDLANNDDIKFRVGGFKRFYVRVINNRNVSIVAHVNFSMQFYGLGANSTINPFPVRAHGSAMIFWDCSPMPIYYTKISISAGGRKFTRYGFTLFGFNIFFPSQDELE